MVAICQEAEDWRALASEDLLGAAATSHGVQQEQGHADDKDSHEAADVEDCDGGISAGKIYELIRELNGDKRSWSRKGHVTPAVVPDLFPDVLGLRLQRHADRWQVWYPGAKAVCGVHSHSRAFGDDEDAALQSCVDWAWSTHKDIYSANVKQCMPVSVCAVV